MSITDSYERIKCENIIVRREDRQRRVVDTSLLLESIALHGVLNPIIITRDLVLVAGERRLIASKELNISTIPCRFVEDLSPLELGIIELEENLKRKDLSWQDQVCAVNKLHASYCAMNPGWTQQKTSENLAIHYTYIADMLRIYEDISDPHIMQAPNWCVAINILRRRDIRRQQDVVNDLTEAMNTSTNEILGDTKEEKGELEDTSIILENFLEWAPLYSGKKFNFIHCDFPYGINHASGIQGGKTKWDSSYNDEFSSYKELIHCLSYNLNNIMTASGHIMFWFPMDYYAFTLDSFKTLGLSVQPYPLVWLKSDNVGVLPDFRRGPRRIYETAFIISREDRFIVEPTSNAIAAPTVKTTHPSEKPEPVLRHFFQMFVDNNTRILDPTCGSGSAIRAAESLGAEYVLGLENNPVFYQGATSALHNFRVLRRITRRESS